MGFKFLDEERNKVGCGLVPLPFQAYSSSPACANASVSVIPDGDHPPSLVVPALPPPPDPGLSRMLAPRKLQPHAVPSSAKTVFLHCWAFLAGLCVAPSFGPSGESHLQQGTSWLELFAPFTRRGALWLNLGAPFPARVRASGLLCVGLREHFSLSPRCLLTQGSVFFLALPGRSCVG